MAVVSVWTTRSRIGPTPLRLGSTWATVVLVVTLIMVAVNIAIATPIEIGILTVEESVTKTGTLTVAIVGIGVIVAVQHHHGVVDVTRPTTGGAEATQEVPLEVAAPRAEVGITTLLPQPTFRLQLQPILPLVGKGIILDIVMQILELIHCCIMALWTICQEVEGQGRRSKLKQVLKRFFVRGRPSWFKFLLQIFISMIRRTCFVKKPQTGTMFGTKFKLSSISSSRLFSSYRSLCPLRLLYCLQVQESSIFLHSNQI